MWLMLLVVAAGACLFVIARPLLGPFRAWAAEGADTSRELLERERARTQRLIKDLETEWEAGGIDEAEYRKLRDTYRVEAALINRRVEALSGRRARRETRAITTTSSARAEREPAPEAVDATVTEEERD